MIGFSLENGQLLRPRPIPAVIQHLTGTPCYKRQNETQWNGGYTREMSINTPYCSFPGSALAICELLRSIAAFMPTSDAQPWVSIA